MSNDFVNTYSDHNPVTIELEIPDQQEKDNNATIIIERDRESLDPYIRWGQDVHKMSYRAFNDYKENYSKAVIKWPEFKEEYDFENRSNIHEQHSK